MEQDVKAWPGASRGLSGLLKQIEATGKREEKKCVGGRQAAKEGGRGKPVETLEALHKGLETQHKVDNKACPRG